jgi:hypothetical protein
MKNQRHGLVRSWFGVQLLAFIATLLMVQDAFAVMKTWTGLGDRRRWSDGLNWSGQTAPVAGDDVTITADTLFPILIDQPVVGIRNLTLAGMIELGTGGNLSVATGRIFSGSVNLAGGIIGSGAWQCQGNATFTAAAGTTSTVDGPVVQGSLVVTGAASRVRFLSGRFNEVRVVAEDVVLAFAPGSVLSGVYLFERYALRGSVEVDGGVGLLTIGPGSLLEVEGPWIRIGGPGMTLSNQGIIFADLYFSDRGELAINPGVLENTGEIGCMTGKVVVRPDAPWDNRGIIRAANSGEIVVEGSMVNYGTVSGTTSLVTLKGTWTNRGLMNGRLEFAGVWNNLGTVEQGRVRLTGDFTTAQLGTGFNSEIALLGRWDNTGANYTLASALWPEGGQVFGGTLILASSQNGSGSGRLRDISIVGSFNISGLVIDRNVLCNDAYLLGGMYAMAAEGVVVDFPIMFRSNEDSPYGGLRAEIDGGSFTLGSNFRVGLLGNANEPTYVIGANAGRCVNRGVIESGPRLRVGLDGQPFVNEGSLIVRGRGIAVGGTNCEFQNAGSVDCEQSAFAIDAAEWSNTGTISIRNASDPMEFSGATTTPSIDRVTILNSRVNIVGRVDNAGHIFQRPFGLGGLALNNCVVEHGILRPSSGEGILFGSETNFSAPVVLDGVVVDEPIEFKPGRSNRLTVRNGTTLHSVTFRAGGTIEHDAVTPWDWPVSLETAAYARLSQEDGVAVFTATERASLRNTVPGGTLSLCGSMQVSFDNQADIVLDGLATLYCDSSSHRLRGRFHLSGGTNASFANVVGTVGDFRFFGPGGTLGFSGSQDSRQQAVLSRIDAPPGSSVFLSGYWRCDGPVTLDNASLYLRGIFPISSLSSFQRAGGTLELGASINLEGTTFAADERTGSINLRSVWFENGRVQQRDGREFTLAGSSILTFSNAHADFDIVVAQQNSSLRLLAGGTVPSVRCSAPNTGVIIQNGGSLDFPVIFDGPAGTPRYLATSQAGRLTIAPSGRVEARGVVANIYSRNGTMTLDVQGTLVASGPGAILRVTPAVLANYDQLTATLTRGRWRCESGGVIDLMNSAVVRHNNADITIEGSSSPADFAELHRNSGALRLAAGADFTLRPTLATFTNEGRLLIGPGSTLTLGTPAAAVGFVQTSLASLESSAGGITPDQSLGFLDVFGHSTIAGTLRGEFTPPYAPACGEGLLVVRARGGVAGTFDRVNGESPAPLTTLAAGLADDGVLLRIMPAADFDRSGFIDFLDYIVFIDCFEGVECALETADINRDGFIDSFDFLDFVVSFETGC